MKTRIVLSLTLLIASLRYTSCLCQIEQTIKLLCTRSSQTELANQRPSQSVTKLEIKNTTLSHLGFLNSWKSENPTYRPTSIMLHNLKFEGLPRWESLQVYSGDIERLHIKRVNLLTNLTSVIGPYTRSGQNWERLKVLEITHTDLSHIPSSSLHLQQFDTLQELVLDHNLLTQIDFSEMANNRDLKRISLANNLLSSVDGLHWNKQKVLEYLNVTENKLTGGNLTENCTDTLKIVDISYNELAQFNLNIKNSQLEELHLSYNSLSEISIDNTDRLEVLRLAGNKFPVHNSIVTTLNKLKVLRVLDISSTEGVHVELTSLPIEELYISPFKSSDSDRILLQNLNSLHKLKIIGGELSSDSWAEDTNVDSLEILDVSHTYIASDFFKSLERFPNLKYLNLFRIRYNDFSLCHTNGSLPIPLRQRGKICIQPQLLNELQDCSCDHRCAHLIKLLRDAYIQGVRLSSSSTQCWDGDDASPEHEFNVNIDTWPTCTDLCVQSTTVKVTLPTTTERAIFTQWKPIEILVVCLGIMLAIIMAIIILVYIRYQDRRKQKEEFIKNIQHDQTDAPLTPKSWRVNESPRSSPRKQLSKSSIGQMSVGSSTSSILHQYNTVTSKNKVYSKSPKVIGYPYLQRHPPQHANQGFDEVDCMPVYRIDYDEIPTHLTNMFDQNTLTTRPRFPLPNNSTPCSSPGMGRKSRSFSDIHQLTNYQSSNSQLNNTLHHKVEPNSSNQLIDHPANPFIPPTRVRRDTDSSVTSSNNKSPYHPSPVATRNKFQGSVIDPLY